jgi:hypothetical protein
VRGEGPNHGNRPPCSRFLPCRTDNCCVLLQTPLSTGEGFLQFSESCIHNGSNCFGNSTGCQNCFNPSGTGPNASHLPICNRFHTVGK